MAEYHLAQINVARIKGVDINDPVMIEFVENLDHINALAESAPGFVWRLKDDSNNATSLNPFGDAQVIINISVWEDVPALEDYVFNTPHREFLKRRREWFHKYGKASMALWWIPAGEIPSMEKAIEQLDHLKQNGATERVFDFRQRFPPPANKSRTSK
jgi:hypothetical protein